MSHGRSRSKDISASRPLSPPSLVIPIRSDTSRLAADDSLADSSQRDAQSPLNSRKRIAAKVKARREHRRSISASLASQDASETILMPSGSSSSSGHFHTSNKIQSPRAINTVDRAIYEAGKLDDESTSSASGSPPSSSGRPRSDSAVPSPYKGRATIAQIADSSNTRKSNGGLSDFRKSLSRRSTQSSYTQSTQSLVNLPSSAEMFSNHSTPKGKQRNLFRRRESSSESSQQRRHLSQQTSTGSLYKRGEDKDHLSMNASNDALESNGTSSTPRKDFAQTFDGDVAGKRQSISRWARRSLRTYSTGHNSRGSRSASTSPLPSHTGSQTNIDDWDNDFITGQGGHTPDSHSLRQAKNGTSNVASAIEGEEGLPRRLGGWLSSMLHNSINLESNDRLSASQSSSTVRRKLSAASLSLTSNSEGTASPQLAPIDTTAPLSANGGTFLKPRSAGVLSNLSASTRGRADSPSSISSNSNGVKTGLDRALRYFLDSGEGSEAEEGKWLLGVWHGPEEGNLGIQGALSEMKGTDSQSSTMDGDTSSQSQRDSEIDFDDNSTEEGSRRTRETSPSNASSSTEESFSRTINQNAGEVSSSKAARLQVPQNTISSIQRQSSTASSPSRGTYTASFQADFSTRIWCTYRSHFVPITRDGTISRQAEMAAYDAAAALYIAAQSVLNATGLVKTGDTTPTDLGNIKVNRDSASLSQSGSDLAEMSQKAKVDEVRSNSSASATISTLGHMLNVAAPGNLILNNTLGERIGLPTLWNRATAAAQAYGLGGRSGLTTDAGWGCMLRTGQSVLANALLSVHLGRTWRREATIPKISQEVEVEEVKQSRKRYAKYVQILSWFMDEPSLACPFGIHRMAREGKRLGKEIGEWFGPSTAGGAIMKLVNEFPTAGLGVNLASDGVVYLDQVRVQSQDLYNDEKRLLKKSDDWGRPVLILIGIRLGLDGVHAMYHDSIKAIFTFPQSVGIAGGRPSSSYYFVGYQGSSLFYLDPHHVRSSIPFRHPPPTIRGKGNDNIDEETEWWLQAYSEAELSTFHTDRPRRMPMKTLDPSMLLGFLIDNEESMNDFVIRVKQLPRPIFSIFESMPSWMTEGEEGSMHDDERALESFSEGSRNDEGEDEDGQKSEVTEISEGANKTTPNGDGQVKNQGKVGESRPRLSVISHETMTTRSESTFEMIDESPAMAIPTPEIQNTQKGGKSNAIESIAEKTLT